MIDAALNAVLRCLMAPTLRASSLNAFRSKLPTLIHVGEIVATEFKFSEARNAQKEDINIAY